MLRFFTFDQANSQPYRSEFLYPPFLPGILTALTTGIAVASAIGVARMWGKNWVGVAILGWVAVWFFIFALMCRSVLRARLKPTRWLLRLQTNGLLVQFRSYLNHHFSKDDATVVHIPYADVEWVRQHRILRNLPGSTPGDDTVSRQKYAELKVRRELADELERRLVEERGRRGPTRPKWMGNGYSYSPHYPVQIVGEIIRIEWSVKPRIKDFLREIGAFVSVRQMEGSSVDFRAMTQLTKEEQEKQLLELIESGKRIDAIQAARHLYKFDLTEAVRFVDEMGKK